MNAKILGLFISLVAILLFYGYVYAALTVGGGKKYVENISKKEWTCLFILFLLSSSFMAYMLRKNQFIYYWDCTMHWVPAASMTDSMYSNPIGTIKTIFHTIGTTDYNWAMPLLYVLPAKIFGNSYTSVVLLVHIFYMCPAYFIISICINKHLKLVGMKGNRIVLYAVITFAMPFISAVLLRGFMDPPVLIISALIIFLMCDFYYDHFDLQWSTLMAIGILTLVVFRRHWAYWVIALILALGVSFLFQIKKETWKSTIKYFFSNMIYIGLFCIIILVFPLRNFLEYSLRDYSTIYTAWNTDIFTKLKYINNAFGNYLIFILISLPFIVYKNKIIIKYVISNLVLIIVPMLLMMRVLLMHDAHFYLVIVPMLILVAYGIEKIYNILKTKLLKMIFKVIGFGFLIFNFICCFWGSSFAIAHNNITKIIFSNFNYSAYYREDIDEIKRLVDDLNTVIREYDVDCYICTSTHNLNSHMIGLAYAPDTFSAVPRILSSSDVDSRDGFNTNFFKAGVVITEEKISTDGVDTKGNYGVVKFLAEQIKSPESPIGRHFKLLSQYSLNYQGKSIASIYVRTSDFDEDDYEYLIDFYDDLYPDNKEMFSDRIKAYMQKNK